MEILEKGTNSSIIATLSQLEASIVEYLFAIQQRYDTMVIIKQGN
jgi:hypothetical protein